MPGLNRDQVVSTAAQWLGGGGEDAEGGASWNGDGHEVARRFRVWETVAALVKFGAQSIALQFPDSLLEYSFFVCTVLEDALRAALDNADYDVFVLGDTSYGECCVDEVAAQHLDADVVVHYGNACLSPSRSLPVFYVFPTVDDKLQVLSRDRAVDFLRKRVELVRKAAPDATRVVVLYDVELHPHLYDPSGEPSLVEVCEFGNDVVFAIPRADISSVVPPSGIAEPACGGNPGKKCCGHSDAITDGRPIDDHRDVPDSPQSPDLSGKQHVSAMPASTMAGNGDSGVVWTECGPLRYPMPPTDKPCAGSARGPSADETVDGFGSSDGADSGTFCDGDVYLWLSRDADKESAQLRNACMKLWGLPSQGVYSCAFGQLEGDDIAPVNVIKALARRYALVDRAKDADRVGIVAGTLGVSGNLQAIERCKRVVEDAGRRWYVMMVGKPTVTKLANFAEIDAFVLIACAESVLLDSREYMQPVLTPFELEVAMGVRDWFGGGYLADFRDLPRRGDGLDGAAAGGGAGEEDSKEGGGEGEERETAVTSREAWTVSVNGPGGAAEFLKTREWRGLDAKHDADGREMSELPTRAVEGRSGVARGYEGEG